MTLITIPRITHIDSPICACQPFPVMTPGGPVIAHLDPIGRYLRAWLVVPVWMAVEER